MFELLKENLLVCGMVGSGVFGLLCVVIVNHFYNKILRDVRQITESKGKWTKEFLSEYQNRLKNQQKVNNPEVFIRAQLVKGNVFGIALQKWKQGIGWGAALCFFLMLVAIYGNYSNVASNFIPQQYLLVGVGILSLLLLMRQFMNFFSKEDMVMDALLDYMENRSVVANYVVNMDETREQVREELINRVTEGISQTAASHNKFSHMLTAEEEKIVKEVIREYLT